MEVQDEPQRSLVRPFAISVVVTVGLSLLVGAVFLPREWDESRRPYLVTLEHWAIDGGGDPTWAIGRGDPQIDQLPILFRLYQVTRSAELLAPKPLFTSAMPTFLLPTADGVVVAFRDGAIRRYVPQGNDELVVQHPIGHVLGMRLSPDHRRLLSWGQEACVWDLASRKLMGRFPKDFTIAVLGNDPESVFCDGHDAIVERETRSGKVKRVVAKCGRVFTMALSPDGDNLVVINQERVLQVVNLVAGQIVWKQTLAGRSSVTQLNIPFLTPVIAFSPTGDQFAIAHEIERHDQWGVSVWRMREGTRVLRFDAHAGRVTQIQYVDQDHLLTAGLDCHLRRWRMDGEAARKQADWDTSDWRIEDD